MKSFTTTFRLSFLAVFLLLTACAIGRDIVDHTFGFNTSYDNQDADVLDYRYGDSKLPVSAPTDQVKEGKTFGGNGVAGPMLRGDFLYVKWRNKATGKVDQDTVDLRHRLPSNIEKHVVYFMVYGSQLYVYLISPEPRPTGTSSIGPSIYRARKTYQIYPDSKPT